MGRRIGTLLELVNSRDWSGWAGEGEATAAAGRRYGFKLSK